ncbi:MAG: ABC transporter ATP-binding protein [Bacteroidota bacterium]
MHELAHLNKYFLKYKYHYILGTLFVTGTHVFSILPARLFGQLLDFLEKNIILPQTAASGTLLTPPNPVLGGLLTYVGCILLLAACKALCSFLLRQTVLVAANNMAYDLRDALYRHYQTLPLSFYRRTRTGDLMARLSEDVSRVQTYAGMGVMFGLNALTLFLMLVPYMFSIHAKLTLCSILPVPFLAAGVYYVSHILHRQAENIQTQLAKLSSFVQETFSGIQMIQAFVRESVFGKHFQQACETYKTTSLRLTATQALFFPLATGVTGLGVILTVFVGSREVLKGTLSIGNIAEFIMYTQLITWPIISISLVTSFAQRASASQKRIQAFLQEKNPIISQQERIHTLQGHIRFQQVSLRYPDSGVQALHSVSFDMRAGSSLAIVGTTGAGKSTVANLLTRLYDPDAGLITIDDIPIQDYAIANLRQQIGYVPQDVSLFPDTIRNNIIFGYEEAEEARVVQAIREADLYETIQKLPQKMDTLLGERGVTLSGGQKQRIAIARALVRKPRILIIDDSLSAVDAKTQERILATLGKVMAGRTTLIISHSVSVAQLADQILVLDKATVAERGTHEALLQAQGLYHKLYKRQQRRHEET